MFMDTRKKILWFCIIGSIFVICLGTLSHFFYEWSGENIVVGILFPANESVWEHLKLAILPTIIFYIGALFFIKNIDWGNYIVALFFTLFLPMIIIPMIFYSYTFFTTNSILVIDILSYVVAIIFAFSFAGIILSAKDISGVLVIFCIIGIVIIIICYLTLTYYAPEMFLFLDETTNKYGLA